ncbi:MAG: 5-formyltetrahydrofolate cyclo-ligase [Gammaproteobacteria bacterium]|nr:5-formyltetrahydrofolate cyclo-ligase [Gammaproteobacteria bacterium]MDH3768666.1 5-formyltetrahydrofolate cyclo-ligase [Gammaproteobacteria bacterium]
MSAEHRKDIRVRMRRARREIDGQQRTSAAADLCARLTASEFYESAQHIAAYMPNDGEIDTWPIIRHAWGSGKTIYLPVLQPETRLGFVAISENTVLQENRFGIPEPPHAAADLFQPSQLDLVLLPVVAFDAQLFRLGMGSGYYDRTFSFIRDHANTQSQLIGVGYDFQRVKTLFPEPWDVPARRIVTDKATYKSNEVS